MARNRNSARASRVLYCAMTASTQPGVWAGSTNRKYRSEASATTTPAIPQAKPVPSGPGPLPEYPYIQGRIQHHRGSLCDLSGRCDRGRTSLQQEVKPREHDRAAEDRQEARLLRENEPGQERGDDRLGQDGARDDRGLDVAQGPVEDRMAHQLGPCGDRRQPEPRFARITPQRDFQDDGDGQQRRRCRRVYGCGVGEDAYAPGTGRASDQDVHRHRHGPDEREHVSQEGGRSDRPIEGDDRRARYGEKDAKKRERAGTLPEEQVSQHRDEDRLGGYEDDARGHTRIVERGDPEPEMGPYPIPYPVPEKCPTFSRELPPAGPLLAPHRATIHRLGHGTQPHPAKGGDRPDAVQRVGHHEDLANASATCELGHPQGRFPGAPGHILAHDRRLGYAHLPQDTRHYDGLVGRMFALAAGRYEDLDPTTEVQLASVTGPDLQRRARPPARQYLRPENHGDPGTTFCAENGR